MRDGRFRTLPGPKKLSFPAQLRVGRPPQELDQIIPRVASALSNRGAEILQRHLEQTVGSDGAFSIDDVRRAFSFVSETDGVQQEQIDALKDAIAQDAGPWRVEGYAGVFNELSAPLSDMFGEYFVRIMPSAFDQVLAGGCDTRFLLNHDENYLLARTTNGTLTLTQDAKGLAFTAEPADVSYARDIRTLLERGDLSQCSFAFAVAEDAWIIESTADGDTEIWEIRQFAELDDVAVVTYPAFPQTTARVREVSKPAADQLAASTRRRLALAAAQSPRRTA